MPGSFPADPIQKGKALGTRLNYNNCEVAPSPPPPPKKKKQILGPQRDSNSRFIFPQFTLFPFYVSFLSQVDEPNKLASYQCMGLHSSAGRALQREEEATVSNPVEGPKILFLGYSVIA